MDTDSTQKIPVADMPPPLDAAAADTIIAHPTTITSSIGVLFGMSSGLRFLENASRTRLMYKWK